MNVTTKRVEPGHATVFAPLRRGGRAIRVGTITREKHGSTRTGTVWIARDLSGRRVGAGHTMDEAASHFEPTR